MDPKNNAVEEMGKYYRDDNTYGACMKESGYTDIQHFEMLPATQRKPGVSTRQSMQPPMRKSRPQLTPTTTAKVHWNPD